MKRLIAMVVLGGSLASTALVGACKSDAEETPSATREELIDPVTCAGCHPDHFREWSGSMHAYAGEDPLFAALNKRMQRETNGALGDFCVKCHAPVALHEGTTKDGLNLADLQPKYRGVTCFFCHTVDAVGDPFNNGLHPADEPVMRASISAPVANKVHRSTASQIHDGTNLDSAKMCGSCHDIKTNAGAHIERTYAEWQQSLFATQLGQTCNTCHMKAPDKKPIATGGPDRPAHKHSFVAIDRAISPFVNEAAQKRDVQDFLDDSIQASLCIAKLGQFVTFRVVLDNVFAGHSFPSGAAADRRFWVELVATKGGQPIYKTGVVEDGKAVKEGPDDPDLWLLRDRLFDPNAKETHLFGLASCYESHTLPFPVTKDPQDPRFYQRNIFRDFPSDGKPVALPDTVTLRLRMMPMGLEIVDDLIASGDLDPSVRSKIEVMQVGPTITWTPNSGVTPFPEKGGTLYECVTLTNQNYQSDKFPPPVGGTCGH